MFSKLISVNLRGSISICSVLSAVSAQSLSISRNSMLQIATFRYTSSQYSIKKNDVKSTADKNDELSKEEFRRLNKNPDSFGTLSSFEPVTSNQPQNDAEAQKKQISKKPSTSQKWNEKYEIQLKNLINEKGLQEAVDVFENEMLKKDHILAHIRIYEWLIDECLNLNMLCRAFELYELMVNRGLKMSITTIEKLTLAFDPSILSIKKVHSLRKIISKLNYKPNAIIYNALIRSYIRANLWQTAFELADEMLQCGFAYEFETINCMFDGCKHDQTNGFVHLLELWHEMNRLGFTPNLHTLNAMLNAIQKCEINDVMKLKQAVELIRNKCEIDSNDNKTSENTDGKELIDDGRPNLLKNPPIIGHLFPLENVTKPEHRLLILGGLSGVFELIREHKIIPTLETVTALLSVTPNSFAAQQQVIRILKKHNILPNIDFFNILLTKVCLRQNFNDAREVLDMMQTFEVETDLVNYGLFAMTCKTAEEANMFFEEIQANNIELDADILNAMLKNACSFENNDFIICILRKMQSNEINPLEETFNMIEMYQKKLFQNLRTQRTPNKRTRNECFKFMRECKQWLRYFNMDKRSTDETKMIEVQAHIPQKHKKRSNINAMQGEKEENEPVKTNRNHNKNKNQNLNIDE